MRESGRERWVHRERRTQVIKRKEEKERKRKAEEQKDRERRRQIRAKG